jgi:hypothetical protein
MNHRWIIAGFLCLQAALSAAAPDAAVAQPDSAITVRTIDGLKQRRLFDLAIRYAESVLADDDTGQAARVDVAVALIDTLGQRAFQGRDSELWEAARRTARDLQQRIRAPREILIAVQFALLDQLQLEKWVRQVETGTASEEIRQQALAIAPRLVTQLEQLQQETTVLLNRRPGPREEDSWFSPNELLTLRYNLQYQTARALQHRAALYGEQQELSRNDVLKLVEDQLVSVLQAVGPEQDLWWRVQADRLAMAGTIGDFRAADQLFQSLPLTASLPSSRQLVDAEWIRILTRRERFDDAVAVAGKHTQASSTPALDLARAELFVVMAGHTDDPTWKQRALDLTASMEEVHGGYWGRLASLAVVGSASANLAAESSLDLLIRVADEAQRKQQWDEALQALDTAAARASAAGSRERAWQLGFRAASIEQTRQHHEAAAARFEQLASEYSDLPEAHAGYLMACWNLTRPTDQDAARTRRYEDLLVRLIETWPRSSSADQARIWLAAIRRARKNWPAAIGLLLDVNAASPLFEKAVTDLRDAAGRLLRSQEFSAESKANVRAALVVRLYPLWQLEPAGLPDNWPNTRARIILQLVELQALFDATLPGDLSQPLEDLLIEATTPDDVRVSAMALAYVLDQRAISLATSAEDRQRQLTIIREGLAPRDDVAGTGQRPDRLVEAARQFEAEIDELPESQQLEWDQLTIDALASTGHFADAIEKASELASRYPRNASVQIRLARLLTRTAESSAEALPRALLQWRKVARSSRQNSDTWYLAKYQVAKLLTDQGQRADALKLLNFIRAVPPGWGEAINAGDFDALYRKLAGDQHP